MVVPFPPGAAGDAQARLIANGLRERLGKPVVVENRPGAAGSIGVSAAANAAPDGHTLLFGGLYMALHAALKQHPAYDAQRDFIPITLVSQAPFLLVVPSSSADSNVSDLVAHAGKQAGKLSFASPGVGTAPHILGEMFKGITNSDMVHVPYKGEAAAMADLIGGQIQMAFVTALSAMAQVNSGRLRALAVTAPTRLASLPEVPTLLESGIIGLELQTWTALFAPAGTSQAIITRLHSEMLKVLASPEVHRAIEDTGGVVIPSTSEQLASRMQADAALVSTFVKTSHILIEE
jgi:tripartite-type tricarboxylate transporter receptor subunit TctC